MLTTNNQKMIDSYYARAYKEVSLIAHVSKSLTPQRVLLLLTSLEISLD